MRQSDPDYEAFLERLPVLRRYKGLVRDRLHHFAMRRPGFRGDVLNRIVLYYHDSVQDIDPVDRLFLKRMVRFADLVMDGERSEHAADSACRDHPDLQVGIGGPAAGSAT